MKWTQAIRRIQNGMSVNAEIVRMPAADLESRTDYLKEVLEAFQAGHALTHQDAPLTAATFVGAAVYWSDADDAYAPALADYSISTGGVVTPAATSRALGIVIEKTSSSTGTVCFMGYIEDVDITVATGINPVAGVYYLSAITAGGLTAIAPPLTVPIVDLSSETQFWVNSTPKGNPHEHQHYSFELDPWPAGVLDDPAEGDPYTYLEAWDTEPGWLAADHANFAAMDVPDGAEFGYNLAYDLDLAAVWPPAPTETARLYMDGVLQRPAQVVINDDGIWWMTNCPGGSPFDTGSSETCGSSTIGCPPDWCDKHLQLVFTHILGLTADAFVTSLQGISPVEVVSSNSLAAAIRGQLQVQLAAYTSASFVTGAALPSTAVVGLTRTTMTDGPLASGVRGVGRISVTGTGTAVVASDDKTYQTGGIEVTVANTDDAREGAVDVVALDDAGESDYLGNLYYRMSAGIDSSLRGRVQVPLNFLPTSPQMTLIFWVLGISAGTLPPLSLSYRRQPYSTTAEQTLAVVDVALTDILNGGPITTTAGYRYIAVESDAFTVAAGDIVLFELARDSGDAYVSDIGILNMRWRIDPL